MSESRVARRNRYMEKARYEIGQMVNQGMRLSGNAFSTLLLLKGEANEAERAGANVCSGSDGKALRAAFASLGYAPEDWCALLTLTSDGQLLAPEDLRTAVCTLGPLTVLLCDEMATTLFREAFANELAELPDLNAAMLVPGMVSRVLGMRVMNLGGFEAALADQHQKQVMWARLKQLPPPGEPY